MADELSDDLSLERLPPDLREWATSERWTALRPVQGKTWDWFDAHELEHHDLIVCAPTATGKTEAVFLPLLSRLGKWDCNGFEFLYICPLKALIDQQTARLTPLFKAKNRRVTAWHGEARAGRAAAERSPEGVLIITPESLEGLLRRGKGKAMFEGLKAVVIDELHAFFGTPRGVQIIAQLARLDDALGRKVTRIGLSATLSDDIEAMAKAFLRPAEFNRVAVVSDDTPITAISFEVRAFIDEPPTAEVPRNAKTQLLEDLRATIAEPMANKDGGVRKALVFCNSRAMVEWCATELKSARKRENAEDCPDLRDLVLPHHGSLDRAERKRAEAALRDPTRAMLVVSSPTLELGLDVGDIEHVVQVDPGPSVASLRQRLGRSGRRAGKLSRLTLLVREEPGGNDAHPLARLHVSLVQGLAQLVLVHERRFEAPTAGALNLSTFVQQTLSMAAQGVTAEAIDKILLNAGPFLDEAKTDYHALIERLGRSAEPDLPSVRPLLLQSGVGRFTYGLTPDGETITNSPSFGAAFDGGKQFTVRAGGEILGQIPGGHNLKPGDPVFFAGRRWAVQTVLERPPTVLLQPSGGGHPPRFAGSPISPSDLVVETMRALLNGRRALPDIQMEPTAQGLWQEAREAYAALELDTTPCLVWEDDVLVLPWTGPRAQATLIAALRHLGLNAGPAHIGIVAIDQSVEAVTRALERVATWQDLPRADDLVRSLRTPRFEKFDGELGPYLQRRNYASARLDIEAAKRAAARALKQPQQAAPLPAR
ncbi:DEAD/DEAH box helicase [Azospirillum argentinense]|uniref:DEAD/DEAH box helicase n=1 Tax=Azospirillum argentinense TaxID=2970906 RepID=A0ABW8VEM7_9PROT